MTKPSSGMDVPHDGPVVIFDGYCNFCNASVNFILRNNSKADILFTANQERAGKEILARHHQQAEDVSTIFFLEKGILYQRSEAALRVAGHLRFPWFLCKVLLLIPAFLRDPVYDFIARNRYRWFGKRESCRVPGPGERERFLS